MTVLTQSTVILQRKFTFPALLHCFLMALHMTTSYYGKKKKKILNQRKKATRKVNAKMQEYFCRNTQENLCVLKCTMQYSTVHVYAEFVHVKNIIDFWS